jgi:integrase
MTIKIRDRGGKYHADGYHPDGIQGCRIRGSLGTQNEHAAKILVAKLEIALSEGPASRFWPELRTSLPLKTFRRFAKRVGYKEEAAKPPATWALLRSGYEASIEQRIRMREQGGRSKRAGLEESSAEKYRLILREFDTFLAEENRKAEESGNPGLKIELVKDITEPVFDRYEPWRLKRITAHKWSRGGISIALERFQLHAVFAFAVREGMLAENPVKVEESPGENPTRGAQPFSSKELSKLRDSAGNALFAFLLLLWTGFRRSDAIRLIWEEIHFEDTQIVRVLWKTRRFSKRVFLPIHAELLSALQAERDRRNPRPTDPVLLSPRTGKPMSGRDLYRMIVSLGKQAGVPNAYPHRFRDTCAKYLFERGASTYYVSKFLGDTEETIEKYYAHFVPELRDRLRKFMESEP